MMILSRFACMQVARKARTAREGKRSAAPKTRCVGIILVSENGPTAEERPLTAGADPFIICALRETDMRS